MSYWELEEEPWENEDNWDGAESMEGRGRREWLERTLQIEFEYYEFE